MYTLTTVSYGLAAVAFAALALLLVVRWRDRMRGSLLGFAVLATMVWALVRVASPEPFDAVSVAAEFAKTLAWTLFLNRALSGAGARRAGRVLRYGPVAVAIATLLLSWAANSTSAATWLPASAPIEMLGLLLTAIFGFVTVEQAIRNTRASESWSAKFVWLAAGALFAYDIALYSASYAVGALQAELWGARGFVVALIAVLLGLGVERVRDFQPQVLMSRQFAFYTTSVVVAGAYLVFVAVAGYFVRVLGGSWGMALQIALVCAGLLGLAILVFSSAAKAQLRVLLEKHFFAYKYDYRSEWLDLTERLTRDAEGSSLAIRAVGAFAHLARATGGGIWVLRDSALRPTAGSMIGDAMPDEPSNSEFCRFLETHEWVVDLDRSRARVGQDADVPLPGWLRELRDGWLAIPLLHERRIVALVVLARPFTPTQLTWEDLDLLRTAGRQAASYFALEIAGDALASERQFAAFNRFTAFLMHDLSNIVAQQRLIVENAARHKSNPVFVDDAIDTIDATVKRMTRLLEQMRDAGTSAPPRRTPLAPLARRVAERLRDREPRPRAVVEAPDAAALVAPERLEHVLEHVVRNAQDATPEDGRVEIVVRGGSDAVSLEVRDTGRGMDAEFVRSRLFRPFDTTKGSKGMGIGAYQTREFARSVGGDVEVSSAPGRGTSFVIRLPPA